MNYKNLLLEKDNGIALITINRPEQLNALNRETIADLHDALDACERDSDVKVIILTGSGTKAFVAGADIKEFYRFTPEEGRQLSANGQKQLFDFVENLSKPVIAAINGYALGGGLELAMSCHIRIASDNARMGLPEVSLGVIPGYGGTQRLPRLVGKGKACEMIFTGEMIQAADALQWGLVNHVTTQDKLMDYCKELAAKIMKNSMVAIASAIRAINAAYDKKANGFEVEIEEFGKCFGTEDFKEGTNAFVEKRKPNFPGK